MALNAAFVNGVQYNATGSSTSIPFSALNLTAGNLLVVLIRWEGGGATDTATATLADTAGNTYTLLDYRSTGSGEGHRMGVFYCLNALGHASNAVTATLSEARTYREGYVAQYSYDGAIQLGDTGNGGSGSNQTTVTSAPALTAEAADLVLGALGHYNSAYNFTPSAEYTQRSDNTHLIGFFDQIPASSFNEAPGGTISGVGDSYNLLTAVFEAVAEDPDAFPEPLPPAFGVFKRVRGRAG